MRLLNTFLILVNISAILCASQPAEKARHTGRSHFRAVMEKMSLAELFLKVSPVLYSQADKYFQTDPFNKEMKFKPGQYLKIEKFLDQIPTYKPLKTFRPGQEEKVKLFWA